MGLDENQRDYLPADRAWLYVTVLTIGYMAAAVWPRLAAAASTTPSSKMTVTARATAPGGRLSG
jgi:hypothetical protein